MPGTATINATVSSTQQGAIEAQQMTYNFIQHPRSCCAQPTPTASASFVLARYALFATAPEVTHHISQVWIVRGRWAQAMFCLGIQSQLLGPGRDVLRIDSNGDIFC